jgi:hypothetical protein
MTNTELVTKSAKTIRAEWLEEIILSLTTESTSADFLFALARIRGEGPGLARPDFAAWQRRFRWIDLNLDRRVLIKNVVIHVLGDLESVNRHDGR